LIEDEHILAQLRRPRAFGYVPGMARHSCALVTGASSGIGKAFAELLATRGHDLVLVARDDARLARLADELRRRHAISCEVLVADLSEDDQLRRVASRLTSGDAVDLVVNNAGLGSSGPFVDDSLETAVGQIQLNILGLTVLAHAALSAMVPRRAGGLLNVSSTAGFQPTPNQAVYGATKAYVTSLTEALHEEVLQSGVHVTALCPGFTRTEFHMRGKIDTSRLPSFLWMDAAAVAKAGLDGLDANRAVVVPGAANKVLAGATHLGPRNVVRMGSAIVTRRLR
jgi:short-subunit dehydrogenase